MIIYEVALEIDREIIQDFENWLPGHVKEMLTIKGFTAAEIMKEIPFTLPKEQVNAQVLTIIVHYKVESLDLLNEYFLLHASRMQAPALHNFNNKFRAKRRVLKLGLS
jgi:hypothetical protein